MAVYGVCVILVLSFIFFEVLDVDGSDFASPMRAATTIKATDPSQDGRRAPLHTAIPTHAIVALHEHAEKLQVQQRVDDARVATPAHPSRRRASRATLARGLLADPARAV